MMDDANQERVLAQFEAQRASLLALAYRMLGDFGRAEDVVQDAWLRWQRHAHPIEHAKAFLLKTVTRLCLNELGSARARREDLRADRLPEPIDLDACGLARVEQVDLVSTAFLVLLQRLTSAERAVFLLREVFEFEFAEIAGMVEKSEVACRQLLVRARAHVQEEKRQLQVSTELHRRTLRAFLAAASAGDAQALSRLLVEDAVLIADAGPDGGTFGRVRNLPGPLRGAHKIAAFLAAVTPQGLHGLALRECVINGQPALLVSRDDTPTSVISLALVGERIRAVFMQADPSRLKHLGRQP
jgi:RNA polymerase sigma-70 factor (ECF subfamily)